MKILRISRKLSQKYWKGLLLVAALSCNTEKTFAESNLPTVEIRSDRTIIYPQRMELDGEESLLDILMMFPDLMQKGFDDMVGGYNLRIDNVAMNGNARLVCSQLKAHLINKVQICDNTGVAKGTIGSGRVIDVNLVRLEKGVHGFVGAQYDMATFFVAPKASLPWRLQVGAKAIFFTDKTAAVRDQQVYAELEAAKQLGRHGNLHVMWHDIFSQTYSALLASVQYRF